VALNELGVSRPILLDEYEPEAVALFKSLVKPGDRVIDVGANIGFHSLLFAQLVGPTGRVLSFEPVKYLYDGLIASVAENHFNFSGFYFSKRDASLNIRSSKRRKFRRGVPAIWHDSDVLRWRVVSRTLLQGACAERAGEKCSQQ
jgi:FkbM family methyltransferase